MFFKIHIVLDVVIYCAFNNTYVHNLHTGKITSSVSTVIMCEEDVDVRLAPLPPRFITTEEKCLFPNKVIQQYCAP